jgi:Mrp family chromosome partitioning ATPase
MRDLRQDLAGLWQTVSQAASPKGGRVLMFIAAHPGEGTGSVAASFARMAAERSAKTTWIVDLDFRRNGQYTAFSQGLFRDSARPGHALDASLGTEQIYSVVGHEQEPACCKLLNVHQIEGQRLLVTRFRNDRLAPGQRVQLKSAPAWWRALRAATDWVVVDAPALEKSRAGLVFAAQADGVVIIVKADETPPADVQALRQEIEAHGGRVAGIVMNELKADARFSERVDGGG